MSHDFAQIPNPDVVRSQFKRDFGHKTTFDASVLVPIFLDEALPGDTFNLKMTAFARLATPIYPIMDNMYMDSFFFAVPYRLVWENWHKFNGEQDDPGDSTDFLIPKIDWSDEEGVVLGSIHHYMGLPLGKSAYTNMELNNEELRISSLPFRAYNLIWNEFFRDENLQTKKYFSKEDTDDSATNYELLPRGKRRDYFTSCLPWPQKADSVIPFTGGATVVYDPDHSSTGAYMRNLTTNNKEAIASYMVTTGVYDNTFVTAGAPGNRVYYDPAGTLKADIQTTINELREGFQLQKLFEKDARGGTRYTEIIKNHFGTVVPDFRIQRPEFLGGGTSRVNVNAIAQTAPVSGTGVGSLAAMGTVSAIENGFVKSFTEHCIVIGLVNIRADLTYSQGIDRMWTRRTRYDFFWPSLQNLGEQAVLNYEIYFDDTTNNEDVFGYQERYAEYRYKKSMVTGLMDPNAAGTLSAWHLSQDFATRPGLNYNFIVENVPLDRCIQVPTQPHFIFDSYFDYKCARPMPVYAVPGLIDHF